MSTRIKKMTKAKWLALVVFFGSALALMSRMIFGGSMDVGKFESKIKSVIGKSEIPNSIVVQKASADTPSPGDSTGDGEGSGGGCGN